MDESNQSRPSPEQVRNAVEAMKQSSGWKLLSSHLSAEKRQVLKKCLEPNKELNKFDYTGRDVLLAQVKAIDALINSPEDVMISWGAMDSEVDIDI